MKQFRLTAVLVLTTVALLAFRPLKSEEEELFEVFARINTEVLKNSRAYETLQDACERIGHRLTGSTNGKRAEEYTFNLLKEYGFKDLNYAPFEVESWSRDTVNLGIAPYRSDDYRDLRTVALAQTPVEAKVSGEIVDVGNGLEMDFIEKRELVKGKIVLCNIGLLPPAKSSKNLHRSEKTALAIQFGAKGVIMVNTVKGHVLLTGTASVTGKLIPVPAVCISLEDGTELRSWLKDQPRLVAEIDMHNFSKMIKARNVIATLKGSDKKLSKEKIVIGGHLDSWDLATGTLDNGLGSFSILDIARTFQALKLRPKRSIEFVMFMGEEQGLLGSRALIKQWVKNNSIDQVKFMFNLDMVNNVNGFNTTGRAEMIPLFTKWGNIMQKIDGTYKNDIFNQAGLHSDHQSFMLEGLPVCNPVGGIAAEALGCYHANCDRMKWANKAEMQNTVRYTAMALYAMANAAEIPAKRLSDAETREFFIKQNLRKELEIGQDWRWGVE
jgi:carboxypeptidase Q